MIGAGAVVGLTAAGLPLLGCTACGSLGALGIKIVLGCLVRLFIRNPLKKGLYFVLEVLEKIHCCT